MDEAPQQPPAGAPSDGPSILGYRDFSPLGQGGFALVYKAYQEKFDRVVAVKILTINLDDRARERFIRECRATGKLSGHPNVVTVLDAGVTNDGRPYMATELMERGSIADWIDRNGPMPLTDALQVGVKMCGALSVVHHMGILHRDVKPQNILVSGYGEPALSDFGISAVGMGTAGARATMTFTPEFTPPEILEGRPPEPAMDVYSLGATIYALLNGQPPFVSNDDEGLLPFIRRLMHDPIPELPAEVAPPEVVEVLAKAMAKDAADRFASADAFGERLQQLQASLGQPVTPMLTKADGQSVDPTAGIEALLRTTGTGSLATPTAATVIHMPAKHNGPWIAAAAIVLVLGLLGAAIVFTRGGSDVLAGGTGTTLRPPNLANPAPPTDGGSITVALRDDLIGLHPATSGINQSNYAILTAIADPLIQLLPDGTTLPVLAEKLEPSADLKTWTITLRPGVTFHDGTQLDAQAVVDSMESIRKNLFVKGLLGTLEQIEATSELTVVVRLTSPWSAFPNVLAMGFGYVLKVPDERRILDKKPELLVGTGPFALEGGLGADKRVLVKRYDAYWGKKPFLSEILFRLMASEEERVAALEKGEVDLVFTSDGSSITRLSSKFPSLIQPNAITDYLAVNTDKEPFTDQRVRDAIGYLIDRPTLVTAMGDTSKATDTARTFLLSEPSSSAKSFDLAKAKALLAEVRKDHPATFLDVKLGSVIGQPANRLSPPLIAMLKAAGFNTIEPIAKEQGQVAAALIYDPRRQPVGGDRLQATEAAILSVPTPADPDFFSLYLRSDSGLNLSRFQDAEIDRLLDKGRSTIDRGERRATYGALAERVDTIGNLTFMVTEPFALVASTRITGLRPEIAADLVHGGADPWVTNIGIQK